MYSIAKNALIVISLLKQHGIRHIVINPGTTNMPIIRGVQSDPFFTCYSIVDERSAMYFAIGLYLKLGLPIATTCTSAQATRNYLPGLTEAYYKHIPILAITVSKHPKFIKQEYMQAPDQTSLPIDAVKHTYALPYISNKLDELYCIRLANEAILELTHRIAGPVQLNLSMLDEETRFFTEPNLPYVKMIKRYMVWEEWDLSLKDKKIMIVIGEQRPMTENQKKVLEEFVETYNAFIYVNHLSNYKGENTIQGNLVLSTMTTTDFNNEYKPDILITIGGQTGDYPLFGKLSSGESNSFDHWRISEDGNVVDTYDKLTKIFECPYELFFNRTKGSKKVEHHYFNLWNKLYRSTSIPDNLPFSNAYIAHQLHNVLPKDSYLNLAILNSLRVWSFYPIDSSIICYSNVAAFGIDGCMSVLLGQSVATDKLSFMVIGDLSFFYDMNSLGIRHLKNNIRILLINNNCGAEFKLYTHPAAQFGKESDNYIAAVGHNSDAKGWTEANNFKYLSAKTREEFNELKNEFISESDRSIVFEIFTKPEDESDAIKLIFEHNKTVTGTDMIKDKVRSLIGEKGISIIKNIIKK